VSWPILLAKNIDLIGSCSCDSWRRVCPALRRYHGFRWCPEAVGQIL